MIVAAEVLATLLALLLVFAQPIRGKHRYEQLVRVLPTDPTARVRWYRRGIVAEWVAVGVVLVIGALARTGGHRLALGTGTDPGAAWLLVVEMLVLIPVTAAVYRWRSGGMQRILRAQVGGFRALLPGTAAERWTFVGLALTAGICEEIVFRGFGVLYVRWLWHGTTNLEVTVVVSVVFGFAHLYQGPRGVILTAVLGALFCWVTFESGSLLPAMIVHALIDLRVVALPTITDAEVTTQAPASPLGDRSASSPWNDLAGQQRSPWTPQWAADPSGRHQLRYWDGLRWTEHVSSFGAAGIDPPI